MAALKPCPFCGGEAAMVMRREFDIGVVYYVQCLHGIIFTPECPLARGPKKPYSSREAAAEAWNRRHYDTERKAD